MQYLRARYYDSTNGRFNRLDPYSGNRNSPLSFHKYGYVHADPLNGIDPSGNFRVVASVLYRSILRRLYTLGIVAPSMVNTRIRISQGPAVSLSSIPNNHFDFANLAQDVYSGNGSTVGFGDWAPVNYNVGHTYVSNSGFSSQLYVNRVTGKYALVFEGTDLTSVADWRANVQQAFTGNTKQYSEAEQLAISVQNFTGIGNLTLVGHSLGGGLAARASVATGEPAVTFNAAGLHSNIAYPYAGALHRFNIVTNYSLRGDILTTYGNRSGVIPDLYGNLHVLDPDPLDAGASALDLHAIAAVIRAMR